MTATSNNLRRPAFWAVAVPTGLAVFLFVVITTTLITFVLPESYYSEARVKGILPGVGGTNANAASAASVVFTEAEVIASEVVLKSAAEKLELPQLWGRRYNNGEPLKMVDTLALLRARLTVQAVPQTSIIRVGVYSEKPDEAAEISNAVVDAYANSIAAGTNGGQIQVLDRATPALRPSRPNKPLNISLGALVGMFLGVIGGGLAGWVVVAWKRRRTVPVQY
jgi:capsular polysaccharide biosynthesis protein